MSNILDNLRVVLVGTRNPLNIGAAARAMSNFGAAQLRLVRPYELAFREARSAVGAAELMTNAKVYGTVAEAVADCRLVVGTTAAGRRELYHELRRLEHAGRTIRKRLGSGAVALLFGSEKVGLSNEDMGHCHWLMRIPTRARHSSMNPSSMNPGSMNPGSMNLGQAVAVCLYELARSAPPVKKLAADKNHKSLAAAADLERATKLLFEVLGAAGYVKPRVAAATEAKLRRMVRRLNFSEADAEVWLGMLRQIQWKLGAAESRRDPSDD